MESTGAKRPRFAYIASAVGIPVQGPSGASAHVRDFFRALSTRFDARLFAAARTDRRGYFGAEVPAQIGGVYGWPSWLSAFRELREIRSGMSLVHILNQNIEDTWVPDFILERHSLFADVAGSVGRYWGIPWALEVNAPALEERASFERLIRKGLAERWQRSTLTAAPLVICVSRWLKRWLEEDYHCKNVHHVPNGVCYRVGQPTRGRRLLGLSQQDSILGYVGSARTWHGVSRLPGIAKNLGMRLVRIGVDFSFYDPQDLADVVSAFDVAVAPYTSQAPPWLSPLKIVLYRSQGVPVVTTNAGDSRILLGDGGILVERNQDAEIADAIDSVRGLRFSPWIRSWETVVEEVEKLMP
ncbi:MAG: glycosyltransferase family 4 protein [Myxococcota bacterium]|nr:glycosyltransferase family 4 protein [Myxococcota bacterium]